MGGLLESVQVFGEGLEAANVPATPLEIGATPFMDDLVIPVSHPCPLQLIFRTVEVAKLLDSTAGQFWI